MFSRLFAAVLISGVVAGALAQTNGNSNDNSSVADRSPQENVRGSNVAARAPGTTFIRPAIQRHQQLTNERVHGVGVTPQSGTTGNTGTTGTTGNSNSAGSNSGLGDLLSSLTGGSVSSGTLDAFTSLLGSEGISSLLSSGGLNSLLGGSVGSLLGSGTSTGSSTTGTTSGTTGTTGVGSTSGITPQQQASLDQLLALRDSMGNSSSGSTSKSIKPATTSTGSGAVAGTQKTAARSQTTGDGSTTEPTFRVRLYDSWLSTTFTALTVAASSRTFIDSIKDFLRPIFGIPAPTPTTQPSSQVRHIAPTTERMTTAVRVA